MCKQLEELQELASGLMHAAGDIRNRIDTITVNRSKLLDMLSDVDNPAMQERIKRIIIAPIAFEEAASLELDAMHLCSTVLHQKTENMFNNKEEEVTA